MFPKKLTPVVTLAVATSLTMLLVPGAHAARNEKVLHSFNGGNDGAYPTAGLISDKAGNLYGTTTAGGTGSCSNSDGDMGCGTIFELSPVAGGGWTERVIYTLQGGQDGSYPRADLTFDAAGNLYGATLAGGGGACNDLEPGCGTVFELLPGNGGAWTEEVLFRFQGGSDGANPISGLVFDHAGNLYGTTEAGGGSACSIGCGTVFELKPSTEGWTETVLHAFAGGTDGETPEGRLVLDKGGNFYGATNVGGAYGFGTIFKLSPNTGGTWTETILYSFSLLDGHVPDGVISDKAGDLYGTNFNGGHNGDGAIFELSAAGKENLINNFGGSGLNGIQPRSGLTFDRVGNLYGTTQYGGGVNGAGTVYRLTPNKSGGWSDAELYSFTGGSDGGQPWGNVLVSPAGKIYGTTWTGGTGNCAGNNGTGCGVVFEINQ